jgi:hypothetical protein
VFEEVQQSLSGRFTDCPEEGNIAVISDQYFEVMGPGVA